MKKQLLVVVDMQNDFVTGSLANPDAEKIIPTIVEEMNKSDFIIFTRDTHDENYLNTTEGKKLPIKHCIFGTSGYEVVKPLQTEVSNKKIPSLFINKLTFGYPDWGQIRIIENYDKIVLVGTCTDICVVSNALILKAAFPDKEFIVKSSACAGLTKEKHEAALDVMRSCQITVID